MKSILITMWLIQYRLRTETVTSADGTILEEGQRLELWQRANMVTWKGRL